MAHMTVILVIIQAPTPSQALAPQKNDPPKDGVQCGAAGATRAWFRIFLTIELLVAPSRTSMGP